MEETRGRQSGSERDVVVQRKFVAVCAMTAGPAGLPDAVAR